MKVEMSSERPAKKRRVGIMAGWGRYPVLIAESLRRQGCETYCLGVIGHADPKLAEICDDFEWIGLMKFGRAVRYFKRHDVVETTMAGKIFKVELFQKSAWLRNLPDFRTIKMFIPHFLTRKQDARDDTLLLAIVDEFAHEGIHFVPGTDYVPDLLVHAGLLTRRAPSAWQKKDVAFGWRMAKEMGRLDVGQSVVVKDQAVIAVEAVEGTDLCIRRAGELCKAGGFTVVKVAKPQQDMRFDVPAIGRNTLESIIAGGGSVLAVEAGKTILIDRDDVLAFADENNLCIIAVDENEIANFGN